jgi:hypothetical protein
MALLGWWLFLQAPGTQQPLPISALILNFQAPPHDFSWRKLSLHELLRAECACPTLAPTKINDF